MLPRRFLAEQGADSGDDVAGAVTVGDDAAGRLARVVEQRRIALQRAQAGAAVRRDRGQRLVDLVRDRGGEFGHRRQAQGAGQLRLGIAQGPLGGLALGHFGLERRVGAHQLGGALLDRRFERLLGAPPLHAPGQGHQRENDKCRKGRQIDRGDLDVVSRRRPEIRRRDRGQHEGQQARADAEPCPGDDGRIERKGGELAGSDFEQNGREVGSGDKDHRQPVSGGRERRASRWGNAARHGAKRRSSLTG